MKTTTIVISSSSSEDDSIHFLLEPPVAAAAEQVSAASAPAARGGGRSMVRTVMDGKQEEEGDEQLEYSDDDYDVSSLEPPCTTTTTTTTTIMTAHTNGTRPRTGSSTRRHYYYKNTSSSSECQQGGEDDDHDPAQQQQQQQPRRRALIPITRELKIDELDHHHGRGVQETGGSSSRSPIRKSQLGARSSSRSTATKVVGCLTTSSSKDGSIHAVPCACCKSYVRCKDHTNKYNKNLIASHVGGAPQKDDDDDCCATSSHGEEQSPDNSSKSSFSALFESLLWPSAQGNKTQQQEEEEEEKDNHATTATRMSEQRHDVGTTTKTMRGDDDKNNIIKQDSNHGPSSSEFSYTVVKCLMESWLHKKGSGNDVFGSTSWKPRWCQLVLAEVHGYSGQVPLLLASWHSSMPKPSTIIVLDEKIAIAIDALLDDGGVASSLFSQDTAGKQEYPEQCYRFDIASDNTTINDDPKSLVTRTFSAANVDLRNDWVQKLNDTISTYGRFKKSIALKHVTSKLPPISPRTKTSSREYSHLEGLDLVY